MHCGLEWMGEGICHLLTRISTPIWRAFLAQLAQLVCVISRSLFQTSPLSLSLTLCAVGNWNALEGEWRRGSSSSHTISYPTLPRDDLVRRFCLWKTPHTRIPHTRNTTHRRETQWAVQLLRKVIECERRFFFCYFFFERERRKKNDGNSLIRLCDFPWSFPFFSFKSNLLKCLRRSFPVVQHVLGC